MEAELLVDAQNMLTSVFVRVIVIFLVAADATLLLLLFPDHRSEKFKVKVSCHKEPSASGANRNTL